MQLIAYFSNGPLQGEYKKVNTSMYRYPLIKRMRFGQHSLDDLPELLYYEYMRQLPPLFEDDQTAIFEYKIEYWSV